MSDQNTYRSLLGLQTVPLTPLEEEEKRRREQLLTPPVPPTIQRIDPYRAALGLETSPMYQRRYGSPKVGENEQKTFFQMIAQADDPIALINRINSSRYLAETFKIDQGRAFTNLDELSTYWMGKVVPPPTLMENVRIAMKAGAANFEIGILGKRLKEWGGDNPAIEAQIAAIEKRTPRVEDIPRPWIQKAILWAAESAPAMAAAFAQGGALGAATGATSGAMLGALGAPATGGLSIPALTAAMASVGFAVGTTKSTIDYMEGLSYLDLRKKGVPHSLAAPLATLDGIIQGAIESAQVVAFLPKIPGIGQALRGAGSATAKKIMATGVLTTVGLRLTGRVLGTAAEEGLEEGLQELSSIAKEQIARELAKDQGISTKIDPQTWDGLIDRVGQAIYQGASASIILSAGNALLNIRTDVQDHSRIRQAARVIGDEESYVDLMQKVIPKPENITSADYDAGLRTVYQQEQKARETRAAQAAEVPPTEYRTPEGRLFAEETTTGRTREGVMAVLRVGNPETGERYGYAQYELTPERVYVENVVSEKGDRTRDLILEIAARNAGTPIQWDPTDEEGAAIKDALIQENPRGPDAGLQWFEAEEIPTPAVVPVQAPPTALTQDIFRRRMIETFNLKPEEAVPFTVFNEVMARNEGISVEQWLNKYFEPTVAEQGILAGQNVAHPPIAATIFRAGGQTVPPLEVDRSAYVGQVRAVFSALATADFHHATHEYFHAIERLALNPDQIKVFENALGKLRQTWTEQDLETLADRFETYLGTGKAPTEGLRSVFEKIAKMLHEIVSWLREHVIGGEEQVLSPQFTAAYDAMFAKPESGLAQAVAAVEPMVPVGLPPTGVTERLVERPLQGPIQKPWQETAQRYADLEAKIMGEATKPVTEEFIAWHRGQVAAAMNAGLRVPANVLAEYPDLASAKAAAPVAPKAPEAELPPVPVAPMIDPKQVAAAWERQERRPTDGSWEGSTIAEHGKILQRLAKRMIGWKTAEQLTVKDRWGRKTPQHIRNTADDLQTLRKLGFAQAAWDREGQVWYARADVPLPAWLAQKATDDRSLEQLPSRADVEAGRVTTAPAVPAPTSVRARVTQSLIEGPPAMKLLTFEEETPVRPPEPPKPIPFQNRTAEELEAFKAEMAARRAADTARASAADRLIGGARSARFDNPGAPYSYKIIHPSARRPGSWEVTWLEKSTDEPTGHTEHGTREEAIKEALGNGDWTITELEPRAEPSPGILTTVIDPNFTPEVAVPLRDIFDSEEVPQFKEETKPLKGKEWAKTGVAPITLWQRTNGRLEIITGRHRLEFARRLGMETIPAQIVRESDGFTAAMAVTFDAESNIRDGMGSLRDFAKYFRFTDITEEEARSRSLLNYDAGRKGFVIGKNAADGLYTLWRAGGIGEEKTAAIAAAAPNNEDLQAAGIVAAKDMTAEELGNYLTVLPGLEARAKQTAQERIDQGELPGMERTGSAMIVAAALAKEAAKRKAALRTEQSALKSALRLSTGDRAKVVEQYGFKAGDTAGMERRIAELDDELLAADTWKSNPEEQAKLLRQADVDKETLALFHPPADQSILPVMETPELPPSLRRVGLGKEAFPIYHATNANFTEFDIKKVGSQRGAGTEGWGLYFAADKRNAERFGRNIHEARVSPEVASRLLDAEALFSEQTPFVRQQLSSEVQELSNPTDEQLIDRAFAWLRDPLNKQHEHFPAPLWIEIDKRKRDAAALREYPEAVRVLVKKPDPRGWELYANLVLKYRSQKEVSRRLGWLGIPGMISRSGVDIHSIKRDSVNLTIWDTDVLGNTDITGPPALFHPAEDDPWILKSQQIVEQRMQGPMPTSAVKGMLVNAGVKAEELKWTGLDDFLGEERKVTPQELTDFIRANRVQLQEVLRGAGTVDAETKARLASARAAASIADSNVGAVRHEALRILDAAGISQVDRINMVDHMMYRNRATTPQETLEADFARAEEAASAFDWNSLGDTYEEFKRANDDLKDALAFAREEATKYEQYTLPGGQRYRELLLTIPEQSRDVERLADLQSKASSGRITPEEVAEFRALKQAGVEVARRYISPHWDEPNVLVHVRFNERTDAEGKRVLFVEEIQSDLHQAGREKGYATPRNVELRNEWERLKAQPGGPRVDLPGPEGDYARSVLAQLREEGGDKIPPAPFAKTWHELAFKRMVRQAAEGNFELLGWTTGEQQAGRYDLSKAVDELIVKASTTADDEYVVVGNRGGVGVYGSGSVTEAEMKGIIGRELTEKAVAAIDKLKATPLSEEAEAVGWKKTTEYEGVTFSGMELRVGGEGMKGFYDKILVDYANKYGKKWGAKVHDIEVPAEVPGAKAWREKYPTGETGNVTVHALDITPAMRESVLQGQYLFHPDGSDQAGQTFGPDPEARLVEEAKLYPSAADFRAAVEGIGTFEEAPAPDLEEARKAEWYQRIWDQAHPFIPLSPERATKDFLDLLQAQNSKQFWAWIEKARTEGVMGTLPPAMQALVGRLSSGKKPADAAMQSALRAIKRDGRKYRAIYANMMGDQAMQQQLASEQAPGTEPEALPGIAMPEIETPESSPEVRAEAADDIEDPAFAEKVRAGTITEGDLEKREQANTENLSQLRKNQAEKLTDERVKQIAKALKAAERERNALQRIRRSKKALAERITRKPGASVDFEYKEMMRMIGETVDPHFRAEKTLYRREQSRLFFEANPEAKAALSEETWKKLQQKSLNQWSITELEDLAAQVKELERLGRFKRGLVVRQEQRLRKDQQALVQATVLRGKEAVGGVGAVKPTSWLVKGWLSTIKPDRVMLVLDNGKPGAFTELLDNYNKGWNVSERTQRQRRAPILKIMDELKFTNDRLAAKRLKGYTWLGEPVDIDGFRYHQGEWEGKRPTLQQVMLWYIGMGNKRTSATLTGKNGNNLPMEVIEKGIASLSPEARQFADAIGADWEKAFPRLRQSFIERFNTDLPGEDHYVPMRRMELNYKDRSTEIAADLIGRAGLGTEFVSRHPTFERKDIPDYWQTPIKTDLIPLWLESLEETEGFINLDLPVKRMHAILEDPATRQAITQVYGSSYSKWLKVFTNNLARPDIYGNLTGIDRLQRTLRQNVVIAYLAFNFLSAAKNLTTIIPYLADAGIPHLVSAAGQWLSGKATAAGRGEVLSNDLVSFVKQRSELVANRSISTEFDLLKQTHGNLWKEINGKIGRAGMKLFEAIDMASICIGWKAVYDRVYQETKNEALAAEAADKATVRGQPSGRVQDMAEMYRSADVTRWFTMFTSALSALWNILSVDIPLAIKNKQLMHAAGDMTALVISGVAIALASGALSSDDPEERKKRLLAGAWTQFIDAVPYVGSEVSAIIQGRPTGQGVKFFPSIQGISTAARAFSDGDIERAARGLGEAVLFGAGLPVTGPKRFLKLLETGKLSDLMGWR